MWIWSMLSRFQDWFTGFAMQVHVNYTAWGGSSSIVRELPTYIQARIVTEAIDDVSTNYRGYGSILSIRISSVVLYLY